MFANADRYAPDDAALNVDGTIIRTTQGVMAVREEHPVPAAVGSYSNPVVALAVLGLVAFLWHRFHK